MSTKYQMAKAELGDIEGFYSNDSNDSGGETLYGWARNYHPEIEFWSKLDQYKKKYGGWTEECAAAVKADPYFKEVSDREYKKQYWDIFGSDDLPYSLGLELFESAVNNGIGTCVKFLQRVLNGLNYNNKFGEDLKMPPDGVFGDNTRGRFRAMMKAGYGLPIQFGINSLQGARYLDLCEKNNVKRKYYRGWIQQRCGAIYKENPGDTTPSTTVSVNNDVQIPDNISSRISKADIDKLKMLADTIQSVLHDIS